jgi:hypothetical protein
MRVGGCLFSVKQKTKTATVAVLPSLFFVSRSTQNGHRGRFAEAEKTSVKF